MEYNGYKIETTDGFGFKQIKPIGRGSVPAILSGMYTTTAFAKSAIDLYRPINKGDNNGKAENSK